MRAFVHYNSRNDWGNLEHLPRRRARRTSRSSPATSRIRSASRRAVAGCDVVFHLAALIGIPYSYVAPATLRRRRTSPGRSTCSRRPATPASQRVVHTSTSETYGTARYTPIDEEHPLQGQSPYSASKIGADKLAESYHLLVRAPGDDAAPVQHLRPAPVAARRDPDDHRPGARRRRRVRLGSLTPVRDFTFVSDTARAFVAVGRRTTTHDRADAQRRQRQGASRSASWPR